MDDYLKNLIDRMQMEDKLQSSLSVSWQAFREAELISNGDLIQDLIEYIDSVKDKNRRNSAYYILGKIAKNSLSEEILVYLISRVNVESDKRILKTICELLSDLNKPTSIDIGPILNALEDKRWQVRQAAILALKKTSNKDVEKKLIQILRESKENIELLFTCVVLNEIGTNQSIEYLENLTKSRNQDIKTTSREAIESIKKRINS